MKFKQFIKDNIKRISSVILCIVLMFSMTITTLAFDGESISPIDKELLKEYIPSADVLYNSTGNPIYSPFNLDVLYWTMKIPIVNEGWECSKYEYFALTTGGFGEDISTTYYVVPERIASGLANWFVDFVRGDNGMPGVYNLGLINAKLSQSTTSSGYNYLSTSNTTWNFGSFQNESSLVDYSSFVKAYVYSVTRSAEGNILSVSELYYGFYTGGAYDNSDAYRMIAGEEYKVYPYLNYNMGINYFRLNMYGNNAVLSLFPSSSGSLGFYSYVSPNIVDEVLGKGNTGESGGDIGGGSTGPDIFFDGDFFTELNNSEVFDLDLPPYPDASGIFDIDIADIWLIPERIVEYLILVIDWVATSFEIFIDKVGGPIEKFFLIMRVIFEKMPEVLRFAFILVIFTLLGLRLLQYSSTSMNMVSGTVSSSYSRISRNKRKNKTKEKNKKGGDD